jgi:hypothetical protein
MLDERGVTVTSARFISGGQTHAMNGITSVKSAVEHPPKLWPMVTILVGALGMISALSESSMGGAAVMLAILGVGILWLLSKKPTYIVKLTSASGETKAYLSPDDKFVGRIVNAINDAIVHRG